MKLPWWVKQALKIARPHIVTVLDGLIHRPMILAFLKKYQIPDDAIRYFEGLVLAQIDQMIGDQV